MNESTKEKLETNDEVVARILVFGAPQDLLNYLPPLQRLPSERISDFYLSESSGAGICRVLKEQDMPAAVFSSFIYRGRENVLRWKRSEEGNNAWREEYNPVTAARDVLGALRDSGNARNDVPVREEAGNILSRLCMHFLHSLPLGP